MKVKLGDMIKDPKVQDFVRRNFAYPYIMGIPLIKAIYRLTRKNYK